jgi:alpha-L-rhamnosidase
MSDGRWDAKWIGYAYDPREDLGVFAFRNRFSIEPGTRQLRVRVSADNRYKLYLNGHLVGFGPQRGDERHWFYETYDLAPLLRDGDNELLALVWNFGWMAPMAQHSARTAFVCEQLEPKGGPLVPSGTAQDKASSLSTLGSWEVARVRDWGFEMMAKQATEFYIDVGPGEVVDLRGDAACVGVGLPNEQLEWHRPHVICAAEERGTLTGGTPWMLIPRSIPPMLYKRRQHAPLLRGDYHSSEVSPIKLPLELRPGESVLLDFEELICAYPRLELSGTAGVTVTLTYDESLWQEDGLKGNRNEVADKHLRGYQDKIVLSEAPSTFEPLWWRTWRYLLLEVSDDSAGEQASATVHAVEVYETGYPLQVDSSFEADDPHIQPIWDVSVRTAERCAGETYFDCPYWEQLQYVGDTRIQALIGYYLGKDRALQRNAVETLSWSIMDNGLTQSRYPSRQTQIIPPFSLWWVMMLYDQMLYDEAPVNAEELSRNANQVLEWFARACDGESMKPEFWWFCDWVPEWRWGVPPSVEVAPVHLLTYVMASLVPDWFTASSGAAPSIPELWQDLSALELERAGGYIERDADPTAGPSEHAEALWRVMQIIAGRPVDRWPAAELEAANAAKCTYYFSYYKHLAMAGADPGFDYLAELGPWKQMIEDGLTTFAENPEPTRSDCHAWSAHPILGFFQIVAGVTSVSPGWAKAKIAPRPGSLRRFDANIAHPQGELRVRYEEGRLAIDTPVEATLEWQGMSQSLPPGSHTF